MINPCILVMQMEQDSGKLWTSTPGAHHENLKEHGPRTIVNIMLSWEFNYGNGLTLGSPAMTQAVLAAWHSLSKEMSFNGMSTKVIKPWLGVAFQESAAGWPTSFTFGEGQLDGVSRIFVGGPISGHLANIYN